MHVNNILFYPLVTSCFLIYDIPKQFCSIYVSVKLSAFINKKTDITYSRIIGMIVKSKVH